VRSRAAKEEAMLDETHWARIEQIVRKSVTGGNIEGQENLLYKAIAEDSKRYRELHARIKKEEDDKLRGIG
jgi:hypothetical protein